MVRRARPPTVSWPLRDRTVVSLSPATPLRDLTGVSLYAYVHLITFTLYVIYKSSNPLPRPSPPRNGRLVVRRLGTWISGLPYRAGKDHAERFSRQGGRVASAGRA